jgi:hypothetical protein
MFNELWNTVTGFGDRYAQQQFHPQNFEAAQQHVVNQQQAQYNNILSQAAQQHLPPKWVFAGQAMTLTDFAVKVYGDTPQATAFILRHGE